MTTDNPRAFPSSAIDDRFGGMSLRDWFAGQAMSHALSATASFEVCYDPVAAAHGAYEMADAMLAEREKPQPVVATDDDTIRRYRETGIAHYVDRKCTTCGQAMADCDFLPF